MNNSHALPFLAGPAYSEMCERRNKVTGNKGYVGINGCTENWLKEKKKKRSREFVLRLIAHFEIQPLHQSCNFTVKSPCTGWGVPGVQCLVGS